MTTISDPSWFVSATSNKNSNIVAMKAKSLDSTTLPCSLLESAKLPKKKTRQRRPVKFDDRAEATIVHHLEPREDAKQLWFSVRSRYWCSLKLNLWLSLAAFEHSSYPSFTSFLFFRFSS